jgi:signal transduction histidine kinase/HAMP domain-containing protein
MNRQSQEPIVSAASAPELQHRGTLGIKGKLFLAFTGMALMTILAGAVAWYAFARISQSATHITSSTVPAMSLSLQLAEKSADITAMAPALMASRDQGQRLSVLAELEASAWELAALVDQLEATGPDERSVQELNNVSTAIVAKLNELDAAVESNLRTRHAREVAEVELTEAHTKFQELLVPRIDDAVFDMVISSEDLTAESTRAIGTLVDDGIIVLRNLMAISAEANLASGLMAEAANISDASFLQPLRERFIASARTIARSLDELPDNGDKLALQQVANSFLMYGSGADNIFELRERELRAGASASNADRLRSRRENMVVNLKTAHQNLVDVLAPILDDATFNLVISGEKMTTESREAITSLVDGGVNTLRLLLSLRAEGNLAAGLLMESGGIQDRSMLQPVRERFTASATHMNRILNQLDASKADASIRNATSRLLGFSTGPESLFEIRARELEQAEKADALLASNRDLANRLTAVVNNLVSTAKANSDAAFQRSTDAVQGGKLLLAIIMVVSVLGAALIMMFYVMRRVVMPLQSMTAAMTDLADGDTTVDIPAQEHSDEVGYMARALKVFRDTAIEVQETNLREIREARRRLVDAIESISEGFSLFDAEDRLVVCNSQYHEILYPGMRDVVTPGTRFEAVLREAAERGLIDVDKGEVDDWVARRLERHRNPAGSHVHQRSNGRWIRVNERKTEDHGTVAVYTDITDDKRHEAQLQAAKDAAEQALEKLTQTQQSLIHAEKMASLGQLTAGIAHEIKNPLNFVNNFAESSEEILEELEQILKAPLETMDEEQREDAKDQLEALNSFLAKIAEHGKRADNIVKGMLSHAQDGASETSRANLNVLIEETLNLAYHGARADNQSFNASLEKDLDPAVGDIDVFPQEMSRVLVNLFTNGFYAMQKRHEEGGDADYRPTLSVNTRNLGDQVEVRVRDNGTGIPDKVKEQIFQPFFTTKPTGEGTGLGLSLSYETVVQQHHGRLEVDSRQGEFTEFVIILPRTVAGTGSATGTV